ncbi:DegT/DnrJ/EryC1/StrS family aminotransferase [Polynucleobacter sp. IMCC 29146]|uniref:DegT/DnrJ/EryC1/StrS family aminotransferase n=1 Tax=Polynucleobacter sp. IMCC 29146 TaxID=2780953 RepID=UPI001F38EDDE|nr:DegT/DnrJ/EryC1/StrS aminotransferase family protein [Polynucleobacter sp. IMCC 29146]MCE7530635.1 DegT/DnrJ/EryC1/StrS aminotransferase family protein [Polynucleobacter sp. IMCC 29146]
MKKIWLAIPRGIIYQGIFDNLKHLFSAFFCRLNDNQLIINFSNKFAQIIGRKYCVPFPLARVALYFTLKAKKFPEGSEILMPPITIKSMLDVVLELKLKPVFVDINLETLSFDGSLIKASITPRTKAILVTYLFGMVPNIEEIVDICRENNIFIIEDFSQCLNGKYKGKAIGSWGDVGIYSASSIKTLDTYGGGLAVCDDRSLYNLLYESELSLKEVDRKNLIKKIFTNLVRNLATQRLIFNYVTFPFIKQISKKTPEKLLKQTGERDLSMISSLPTAWFTKYSSLQASVGLKKIHAIEHQDKVRIINCETVKSALPAIRFPEGVLHSANVYWQLIAYFTRPLEIQKSLRDLKIDTSKTSLTKISNLSQYPYTEITPNANHLYENSLFIPAHFNLTKCDLEYLVEVLKGIHEK